MSRNSPIFLFLIYGCAFLYRAITILVVSGRGPLRIAQVLVGIPVMLPAIKTVIWLFTTAPHGQCGDCDSSSSD
ncbi:TPA: hypothetical protein JD193_04240 [Cronobacter sakazakii]|nr:hypothetical protein [Cronobacter sakazakii]HAU5471495.1 hypothetical protein [Cronobacter sakazakii]